MKIVAVFDVDPGDYYSDDGVEDSSLASVRELVLCELADWPWGCPAIAVLSDKHTVESRDCEVRMAFHSPEDCDQLVEALRHG
jgi:hypothetical protein